MPWWELVYSYLLILWFPTAKVQKKKEKAERSNEKMESEN